MPSAGLAPGRSVGRAHRANTSLQPCFDAGPDTVPLLCCWQHWPPAPCLRALINELPCADETGSAKWFFVRPSRAQGPPVPAHVLRRQGDGSIAGKKLDSPRAEGSE